MATDSGNGNVAQDVATTWNEMSEADRFMFAEEHELEEVDSKLDWDQLSEDVQDSIAFNMQEDLTTDETTGLAGPPPNVASDVPPTPTTAPAPAPTALDAHGKKISAFKQRQMEKGRDSFIVEGPQELVDMMRAAAHIRDDMSLASWVRFALADAVNAANLTHEVATNTTDPATNELIETKTSEPWKFDPDQLDESKAKRTTRGLSPEAKKAVEEKKKLEQKEEREAVKEILKRHRAKLQQRDPEALSLEAEARAKAAAAVAGK